MLKLGCISAILATLALVAPAGADDGAAGLAAGGIEFTHNRAIRMASEDLYVSPEKVRVRFVFQNTTDHDVVTMIAFPLPDIDLERWGGRPEYIGGTTGDPLNFVGFRAVVDSRPAQFNMEQRAFLKGRDVTAFLERSGVMLNQMGQDGAVKVLTGLSQIQLSRLEAVGLTNGEGDPLWTVRTKFFWIQHFPPHSATVIEHTYRPIDGSDNSSGSAIGDTAFSKRYCVDASAAAQVNALARSRRPNDPEPGALETAYILKTAKTWKGPIGSFHLTLDKVRADSVLSLCWDGRLKRTSPTTYEYSQANFVPSRDIEMAVLR